MNSQYIFDRKDIKFRKKRTSVWAVLRRILVFFVATASMAVLYYVIFSLIFSTHFHLFFLQVREETYKGI